VNTAVLTFPGHFFQTAASIQSLLQHYPEYTDHITIIADDVQCAPWSDYVQDLQQYFDERYHVVPVSTLPGIRDCVAGWWRQQLIKLTLDQILPDDAWFVVDGDVIFQSRCDVQGRIPISRRYDETSRWSQMCVNYVKAVLGINQGNMHDQGQPVITSPVPFRCLDRDLLQSLRFYVETRFAGDFVDLHLQWFQDQTIVADIDPPTRWVMSEWELIECFRQMVQGHNLPYLELGSGYQTDVDLNTVNEANGVFLHSYLRDTMIGAQWFQNHGISVDDGIWQKSLAWYDARERQRLI
jgi:hypothetical protein